MFNKAQVQVLAIVIGMALLVVGMALGLAIASQAEDFYGWEDHVVSAADHAAVLEGPAEHVHEDEQCYYGVVTVTGDLRSVIGDGEVCGRWGAITGPSKLYPYRYDYPQEQR